MDQKLDPERSLKVVAIEEESKLSNPALWENKAGPERRPCQPDPYSDPFGSDDEKETEGEDIAPFTLTLKAWRRKEQVVSNRLYTFYQIPTVAKVLEDTDHLCQRGRSRRILLRVETTPALPQTRWALLTASELATLYDHDSTGGKLLPTEGRTLRLYEAFQEQKAVTLAFGIQVTEADVDHVQQVVQRRLLEFWSQSEAGCSLEKSGVMWLGNGHGQLRLVLPWHSCETVFHARCFVGKFVDFLAQAENEELAEAIQLSQLRVGECLPVVGTDDWQLCPVSLERGMEALHAIASLASEGASMISVDTNVAKQRRREVSVKTRLMMHQCDLISGIAVRCGLDPRRIRWHLATEHRLVHHAIAPHRLVLPLSGGEGGCLISPDLKHVRTGYLEIECLTASYRCFQCSGRSAKHWTQMEEKEVRALMPNIHKDELDLRQEINALPDRVRTVVVREEAGQKCEPLRHARGPRSGTGVQRAIGSGKSYRSAELAAQEIYDYVMSQKVITPEIVANAWGELKKVMRDKKALIELLKVASILSILPRILCVMNLQQQINKLIMERIEAAVMHPELGCPADPDAPAIIQAIGAVLCFTQYQQFQGRPTERNARRVIVCLDSVWKFAHLDYDMLMMDESESNLASLTSTKIKKGGHLLDCAYAIEHFVRTATSNRPCARGVFFLDADLSVKTLHAAQHLLGARRLDFVIATDPSELMWRKFKLYIPGVNKVVSTQPGQRDSGARLAWYANLRSAVIRKEKLFVVTNSRRQGFIIQKFVTGLLLRLGKSADSVAYWHGGSSEKDKAKLTDLSKALKQYDIVIFSPVLTVGSDFSDLDYFDRIFCYCVGRSTDFETQFQTIGRVRSPKTKEVHLFIKLRNSKKNVELTREEIESSVQCRTAILRDMKFAGSQPLPKWLEQTFINETLKQNLALYDYGLAVVKHLVRTGCSWEIPEITPLAEEDDLTEVLKASDDNQERKMYTDDKTFPFDGPVARALVTRSKTDPGSLSEVEKLHVEKIQFIGLYQEKPSFEHYITLKTNPELQSLVRRSSVVRDGMTATQAPNDAKVEDAVGICSDRRQHEAVECLLQKFGLSPGDRKRATVDHFYQKQEDDDTPVLSSELFEEDKAGMSMQILRTAALIGVRIPPAGELKWKSVSDKDRSAEKIMNEMLMMYDHTELVAVCPRSTCQAKLNCEDASHRARKVVGSGNQKRREYIYTYVLDSASTISKTRRTRLQEEHQKRKRVAVEHREGPISKVLKK